MERGDIIDQQTSFSIRTTHLLRILLGLCFLNVLYFFYFILFGENKSGLYFKSRLFPFIRIILSPLFVSRNQIDNSILFYSRAARLYSTSSNVNIGVTPTTRRSAFVNTIEDISISTFHEIQRDLTPESVWTYDPPDASHNQLALYLFSSSSSSSLIIAPSSSGP